MTGMWIYLVGLIASAGGSVALWYYRQRLTIKAKLTVLCIAIGFAAVLSIGLISINRSSAALVESEKHALEAVCAARQAQVEEYFDIIHHQMFNFAQNRMITEATVKFTESFHAIADQVPWQADDQGDVVASLRGYYDGQFKPRLKEAGQDYRGAATYIPANPSGRIAQAMYLSRNPNPVGEKHRLDAAQIDCDYNHYHALYHPRVRDFLESFGYYDIFLFDLTGNLIYSVFKETDYGTSFINGPYSQTNFAEVYREARDASSPGQVFIKDFKPYEPSYGAAASFIGSPVFHDGKKVGVAIFQMPVGRINTIMNRTAGMGRTGETYLVADDHRMRSNSRFSDTSTIFVQKVETETADAALAGQTGTTVATDYHGKRVVGAYAPLEIEGLNWAVLAEKEYSEVLEPAATLRNYLIGASLVIGLIIAAVSSVFAYAMVRPIRGIVDRIKDIAQGEGDLTQRVDESSSDELGELGRWFNLFVQRIHDIVADVAQSSHELASAATELAANAEQMSQGINQQTDQANQVAAAVEQMSASVGEVANKSADTAKNANEAGEQAQAGGQVVTQTIEQMRGIAEMVNESSGAINELGQRTEQIGQIIDMINDIADQTNLLALNAAIEAARAGEHGRGFAVVADEVRKLAERTTQATDQVSQAIEAIQRETAEAVERMTQGTQRVDEGVSSAEKAGESLTTIVDGSRQLAEMIGSIASAAEQQSSSTQQIAESIEQITAVTRQSAEGASQAASVAGQLSSRAEALQQLVGQFKLASTAEAPGAAATPTDG